MTDTTGDAFADRPRGTLAPLGVAELPAPPRSVWPIVGPGIVAAGVGLGSGEFIFFPYVASQIGLGFLWAAVDREMTVGHHHACLCTIRCKPESIDNIVQTRLKHLQKR